MDLPTLDFGKFNDGTTAERLQLSHDLVDSFQKHGFVKLKHHGIPQADVAKLLGLVG
jgi:isopenicillin N synthase-like dioxygenase